MSLIALMVRDNFIYFLINIHKESGDQNAGEHEPELYLPGLPVVAFRLLDEFKNDYPHVQQAWI
ncbi:hypothetical protein AURDEDRAFT_173259 [Auricularia subglabra TFB-10046 SS5]|uniref:Uncharacterized protein n=1 Tax=Auricularia subglabra (strain TFB-10046 / SS5) TaxID=717982 RepID=J0DB74_AURST|nr:hypothetical protein AURDEDRAFT_173259 [Auricularia subglabra TFB-10046 SS5]